MKRILFVCSHFYSGSTGLCAALDANPRIQNYNFGSLNTYSTPFNLISLADQRHKLKNKAAIYMDELLENHQLQTKHAYKTCQFIYVIREPENVLSYLIGGQKIKAEFASRYYLFRLRRLCEMAKRTGGVLLTWDDLQASRGLNMIEDYLGLREPIQISNYFLKSYSRKFNTDLIGRDRLSAAEDAYQRYLFWLKNCTSLNYWV